jgi:hypothetical protein
MGLVGCRSEKDGEEASVESNAVEDVRTSSEEGAQAQGESAPTM